MKCRVESNVAESKVHCNRMMESTLGCQYDYCLLRYIQLEHLSRLSLSLWYVNKGD